MAKTVAQILALIRKRADIEGSLDRFPDAELLSYANESFAELHDILEDSYEDYHLTKSADVVVASTSSYTIPYTVDTVAGPQVYTSFRLPDDCNKVRMLRYKTGDSRYVPLDETYLREMHLYEGADTGWADSCAGRAYLLRDNAIVLLPESNPIGTYQLWYTTRYTELLISDLTARISDQQGWHVYAVVDAAIKAMKKDQADASDLEKEKQALLYRIKNSAIPRNAAQPKRVVDVRGNDEGTWYGRRQRGFP